MSPIQSAHINALLADASYVDVAGGINSSDMRTRLTQSQATYLAANFTVAASHQSPDGGFDAVVWQIKANSALAGTNNVNAGKIDGSMRGTQGAQDLADDASLAVKGIPHLQIANRVNWWLKNTAAGPKKLKCVRANGARPASNPRRLECA